MADPKGGNVPPTRAPTVETVEMPPPAPIGHAPTLMATDARTSAAPTPAPTVDPDLDEPGASDDFAQRYEAGDLLGEGGMGEVRRLRDRWVGRDVAIKSLRGPLRRDPNARARFLREVRVQGQLEHPGVIPVYDVARGADDATFFTMRRVRGPTLADALEAVLHGDPEAERKYSRRRLLTAFVNVCMTVHYAHTRGVVHRDLKPDNIMLGDFGEVYVLDWGIAHVAGSVTPDVANTNERSEGPVRDGAEPTDNARVVGTPGYMAPEQVLAQSDAIGPRSDVYALGVILFEVLTLQPMVRERAFPAVVHHALMGEFERPSERAPERDIAPELDVIVQRATARDPAARFTDVRELADAVERYLDGDRDLALRRSLAVEQASRAQGDAAIALGDGIEPADAGRARLDALRGTMRALALDPDQADAQRLLGRLMLERPKVLPPQAEREMVRHRGAERAEMARLGVSAWLTWLAALPIMMWMGVRSPLLVYGGSALTVANVLLARTLWRRGGASPAIFSVMLVLGAIVASIQSSWLGPFVLMPTSVALTTTLFAMYGTPLERRAALLMGVLAVTAPYALEALHLVPPSFAFEQGRMVLFPRALELPRGLTVFALLYCSVGYTILPAMYFARLRDSMAGVEQQLHLQAWQLRHLFPGVGSAGSKS